MWKKYSVKHKPLLLLLLMVLLLMSFTGWQWLQVTQLGYQWRQLPQRTLAGPLADYAELQAVRALLAEDDESQHKLVEELISAQLVVAAQLYDGGGQLKAEAGNLDDGEAPYIRQLHQESRPVGFLRLQLATSPLTMAQSGIWQQLLHHLSWLFPLCSLLGILAGMGFKHRRQGKRPVAESPTPSPSAEIAE